MMRWTETLHTWVVLELITMTVFVLGPGTVLEMVSGICDGRTLTGHSGAYVLQNVTGIFDLTGSYQDVTGY